MNADVWWIVVAVGLVTCELTGHVVGRGWPTLSSLARWVGATLPGWVALVVVWLWFGWHLFGR